MTDSLEAQVIRLMFTEHLGSRQVSRQLQLPVEKVVAITSQYLERSRQQSQPPADSQEDPLVVLRRQVYQALIARTQADHVNDFPAGSLVRLFQLLEDLHRKDAGESGSTEQVFGFSPETMQAIEELLEEEKTGRE